MTDKQITRLLNILELNAKTDNMISDDEVLQLLGIKKQTLYNKLSRGYYASLYRISPLTGKRFWFKDKLMGL